MELEMINLKITQPNNIDQIARFGDIYYELGFVAGPLKSGGMET